ncbi:MAG: hypothetical protein O2854_02770 [Chloroflexi bacterium]|nr:hypothetical protein [Chloroflexota bacterium]
MVKFKSCPRCKGDMHLNTDMYGTYRECLMCGYMVNLKEVVHAATVKVHTNAEPAAKAKQHAAA